jgi:DNA-binding CsgD family transcriptional regulator
MPAVGFDIQAMHRECKTESGLRLGQMTGQAARIEDRREAIQPASRAELTLFLSELAETVGAQHYMLLAVTHDATRSIARVAASNWIFDAVQLAGMELLARLATGSSACLPGSRPKALRTGGKMEAGTSISAEDMALLRHLDHAEIYSLRLNVGRQRYFLLLSADAANSIDAAALSEAQMRCNYVLSAAPDMLVAAIMRNPLLPRERECLSWAAEGKTSEDIALILDFSANMANGCIATAMEKLEARNRVVAIATAIRTGIL